MIKTKQKVLRTFAVGVLAIVMLLSFAITSSIFASAKRLQAFNGTYPASTNATNAGTLYTNDGGTLTWNKIALQNLITPLSDATNGFSGVANAGNIRTANGGKSLIVNFGGLDWIVMYCSESTQGDVIATLWLSGETTLESSTFNDSTSRASNTQYPSNMYSASRARAVLNGTYYVDGSDTKVDGTSIRNGTLNSIQTAIGSHIVEPQYVAWQEKGQKAHEAVANGGLGMDYDLPNDNWGDISTQSSISRDVVYYEDGAYKFYTATSRNSEYSTNYSTSTASRTYDANDPCAYDAWKNDKFWLPSLTETGGYQSATGIWNTNKSERSALADRSWLRSSYSPAYFSYLLGSAGDSGGSIVNDGHGLRPSLHLNLKSVALAAGINLVPEEKDGIEYSLSGNNAIVVGYTNNIPANVVIPATVTIDEETYTVTGIADGAFNGCTTLESVTLDAESPIEIGTDVFEGCTSLGAIYVPNGTVGAYKSAWSAYAGQIEELPATGVGINVLMLTLCLVLGGMLIAFGFRRKEQN